MDTEERLDRLHVKENFDVRAAISAIEFYFNLAKHKGETIVVEIYRPPPPKGVAT